MRFFARTPEEHHAEAPRSSTDHSRRLRWCQLACIVNLVAILVAFALQLTHRYAAMFPVFIVSAISGVLALDWFRQFSLSMRRGAGTTVGQAMSGDVQTVPLSLPLARLFDRMSTSRHEGYPVVDENGRLVGMISRSDLPDSLQREQLGWLIVADIMPSRPLVRAWQDEPLQAATERMLTSGVKRLPVVRREAPDRLVGIISRTDVFKAMLGRGLEQSSVRVSLDQIQHSRAA